jgi:hypothetical protein
MYLAEPDDIPWFEKSSKPRNREKVNWGLSEFYEETLSVMWDFAVRILTVARMSNGPEGLVADEAVKETWRSELGPR